MVESAFLSLRNQIRHQMSKQTAVDWLIEQIRLNSDENFNAITISKMKMEAKKMEREQIIAAFCEGYDHDGDNYDGAEVKYYEQTYKGGQP
jgi:hypothetical protein